MKLFGIRAVPDGWRWPNFFLHILDADSRKVTFGWQLFIVSSIFNWKDKISDTHWMMCVTLSTILIGGGTVVDELIKVGKAWVDAKWGGKLPAAPAAAPQVPA